MADSHPVAREAGNYICGGVKKYRVQSTEYRVQGTGNKAPANLSYEEHPVLCTLYPVP